MVSKFADTWIWVGVGVLSFFAVRSVVVYALEGGLRRSQSAKSAVKPRHYDVTQETEDAVSLESIGVLSRCPNYEIRNAALKILSNRIIRHRPTLTSLRDDLQDPRLNVREAATAAHLFLHNHLECCPFAFSYDSPKANNDRIHNESSNDNGSTSTGINCPLCRVQFRSVFSQPTPANDDLSEELNDNTIRGMISTLNTARTHAASTEERALRRRRREAMVFHEGDLPIVRGDIIHPGDRRVNGWARDGVGGVEVDEEERQRVLEG